MQILIKAAALRIPPVRRLYAHILEQIRREQELLRELASVMEARDVFALQVGREQHLIHELAKAAEERDSLELQLYIMRSDLQRTAVRNQELSAALHACEKHAQQCVGLHA